MSAPVPVTYLADLNMPDEKLRRCFLREMAVNGVKHLVLSAPLIARIDGDFEFAEVIGREVAAEGLSFMDSHAPYGAPHWDLNCDLEHERHSLMLRHKLHMRIAADFNVHTMTIHVGGDHLYPEIPLEKHFSRICSMLDGLLPVAEKLNIILCLENSWARSASTQSLWYIKEKFPTSHLGFCYDAGHDNIMNNGRLYDTGPAYERWNAVGINPPPWEDDKLEKMLPHVVNCHLHDNMGNFDRHDLPGRGNVDWQKVTALLRKAPRLQVIQSEVNILRNCIAIPELTGTFEKIFN